MSIKKYSIALLLKTKSKDYGSISLESYYEEMRCSSRPCMQVHAISTRNAWHWYLILWYIINVRTFQSLINLVFHLITENIKSSLIIKPTFIASFWNVHEWQSGWWLEYRPIGQGCLYKLSWVAWRWPLSFPQRPNVQFAWGRVIALLFFGNLPKTKYLSGRWFMSVTLLSVKVAHNNLHNCQNMLVCLLAYQSFMLKLEGFLTLHNKALPLHN